MVFPFLIQLAIGLVLNVLAYLILPKPKGPKPPAVTDLESPTAENGRPIPVAFGTILIRSPNVIGWADKSYKKKKVKA